METTEEECVNALLEAAEMLGESPTKAQYEELGLTPSSSTIIRVVGGWNTAKEAANLETNPSRGSRVQQKPDDVEVTVDTPWEELTVDQRWYYKNAEADNEYERYRRANLRTWIHDYKADSDGCLRCEVEDPICLDFHHQNPDKKEMAVNKMVPFGYSKDDIQPEIEECVLLCANCHRIEHIDEVPEDREVIGIEEPVFADDPTAVENFGMECWPETLNGLRKWSYAYRRAAGCRQCGETDPRCLQFHHTDTAEKNGSVGNMITNGCGKAELRSEVAKCEILCANCHRKTHHDVSRKSDSV